jgi:hypothetical protein
MKELFLPYKQAKEIKECGFASACLEFYYDGALSRFHSGEVSQEVIKAPTYHQAFSWFRNKHQLHATITSRSQESWQWHITKPGEELGTMYEEDFESFEKAEKACMIRLIKLIKEAKKKS